MEKSPFDYSLKGVCIHHTGFPNLAMREGGFNERLMGFLKEYYSEEKGWSAAPHLFIDDKRGWGLTPLNNKGVHAISFNSEYLGFELLGNYDKDDDHLSGRGSDVWDMGVLFTAAVLYVKGFEANDSSIKFHRECTRTNKTCPGEKVSKSWFIDKVAVELKRLRSFVAEKKETTVAKSDRLAAVEYQLDSMYRENAYGMDESSRDEFKTRCYHVIWQVKQLLK